MQTSSLSPSWARIIHRLHTLGVVESTYANSLSKLVEVGRYPHHITSANEKQSQSIDDSTCWNFLNWQQGWVTLQHAQSSLGTEFSFYSLKNTVFHSLRLLEAHHVDCLQCLLQLFSKQDSRAQASNDTAITDYTTTVNSISYISYICEQSLTKPNKSRGFKIDMLTEGGIISKLLHAKNMSIHNKKVQIHCSNNSQLELYASNISHIHSKRVGEEIHTSLYNHNNLPQVTLRLIA